MLENSKSLLEILAKLMPCHLTFLPTTKIPDWWIPKVKLFIMRVNWSRKKDRTLWKNYKAKTKYKQCNTMEDKMQSNKLLFQKIERKRLNMIIILKKRLSMTRCKSDRERCFQVFRSLQKTINWPQVRNLTKWKKSNKFLLDIVLKAEFSAYFL